MAFSTVSDGATQALEQIGSYLSDMITPRVRLGVTGLSGAGKTVFMTALVRNLVSGGRLPFFAAYADGRLLGAHLEPQPDDYIPRFDYEAHLAALGAMPPTWPQGTLRISQLRLTARFQPGNRLRRTLGISRLNIDIFDYPGEWLIDLSMLGQGYAEWSAEATDLARDKRHREAGRHWLDFQRNIDPYAPEDEDLARTGACLFRSYLRAARTARNALATLGPGRFLMPGDLEGSPLLTFFPLDLRGLTASPRGSLAGMMARRYESYRQHVVRPFFRDHFSKLDRQIVLIDVLSGLNAGPDAVTDLQVALESIMRAFRPGANSWLASLVGRRLNKILFAATKADHLPRSSYDRLEAILRLMTNRAISRATGAGADVKVMALAALRATREGEIVHGGERFPCIIGVPMAGETIDGRTFTGNEEAAVFPGDLPADPRRALRDARTWVLENQSAFLRFRPPRVDFAAAGSPTSILPHIRLDRALEFLLGDWLA